MKCFCWLVSMKIPPVYFRLLSRHMTTLSIQPPFPARHNFPEPAYSCRLCKILHLCKYGLVCLMLPVCTTPTLILGICIVFALPHPPSSFLLPPQQNRNRAGQRHEWDQMHFMCQTHLFWMPVYIWLLCKSSLGVPRTSWLRIELSMSARRQSCV